MVAEFATIVGLISAFLSGRKVEEQLELSEFLVWLSEHNHSEIRSAIESNHVTTISIKALLNRGVIDINEKLDQISNQIAVISSKNVGLKGLAEAYASSSISEQALGILTLMNRNQSEFFLVSRELSAKQKRLILSSGPNYLCEESQFLEDDLSQMVDLGLLIRKSNSKGEPVYYFTRIAAGVVTSL